MPLNLNPRAKEILEWHGHARGGVHVPFQAGSNPFGSTIQTKLISKLRDLAISIATDSGYEPRWIFLVGGPGNGKSETVQDFLTHLDEALGLNGTLCAHLAQEFGGRPIIPRKVEVLASELSGGSELFAKKVGRLVVVQDATATEDAQGDAAQELANDVVDLLTLAHREPLSVFIVCANRGLLSRALRQAFLHWGGDEEVTRFISELIRASSLGTEALEGRADCWPLATNSRVACWPLDLESLLVVRESEQAPFTQVFGRATSVQEWESMGRCLDCSSRELCPLRQNAEWLREPQLLESLRVIIRHGELASGQRWNFRDLFSLVAEIIVGQWSDFGGNNHPCAWVHENASHATVSETGAGSVISLVEHLYPHALFRGVHMSPGDSLGRELLNEMSRGISREVISWACDDVKGSSKPIRVKLSRELGRLDPAIFSPTAPLHPLRLVEDHFSQSVELGRLENWRPKLTTAELLLLELLDTAEHDWDLLARNTTLAVRVVQILRRAAAIFVKRSIGVRTGHHAMEDYLNDYEASLRDPIKLREATAALQLLLGKSEFRFNVVESFGQPQAEEAAERFVTLEGDKPGIVPHPAPTATPESPGHDLPSFEIRGTGYRMPLTFDFYLALRLQKEGCAGSSLPASVRAALDRVRHRFAGRQIRDLGKFVDSRARIVIGKRFFISVPDESSPPCISKL